MAWYNDAWNSVTDFGQGGIGRSLLGAGVGAGLGALLAPKAPSYTPVSAGQLDAATMPYMQRNADQQMQQLLGRQGAKGGMSSADMYKQAQLGNELAMGLGVQKAQNLTQAQQSANQLAQAQYNAQRQRVQDIMSGGAFGYNVFNPVAQKKKEDEQNRLGQ
jgi:hypothetical protein